MRNLLKQLEKESEQIFLTFGRKEADRIASELPALQAILEHVKDHPRDGIHILETAEEVASRQVDSRYPNPNDPYMYALLYLLRQLRSKYHDDSSRFYLAEKAADGMTNSCFSLPYRAEHFIENLYDLSTVSKGQAIDELYDVAAYWKSLHQFDKMNSFLQQVDLSRLPYSVMYSTIHLVCNYIDYLPYYPTFWKNVHDEFTRRSTNPDAIKEEVRTPEQINSLLGRWKDGPGTLEKYNHLKQWPPNVNHEQVLTDKIEAKRQLAITNGDEDLANILKWYNDIRLRSQEDDNNFRRMRARYGEKEVNKMAAEALRAMAEVVEKPGMHFMTSCVLPRMPIWSGKDRVEEWFTHLEISIMRGPIGG